MKEANSARHVSSTYTRDLGVVFEESDTSSSSSLSPSLNFLRHKVSFPNHYTSTPDASSMPLPNARRARAGTMPSFHQQQQQQQQQQAPPERSTQTARLLTTIQSGRHRSGSLNLPPVNTSYWGLKPDEPLSPSSEQLLQNDNDFSIARTMRSLGLEDDEQQASAASTSSTLFHHPTPPEFLLPSRSLLSGANRNRSYSVNATARYEPEINLPRTIPTKPYVGSLEGFTRQQQNRPRASSMGRADTANNLPLTASFWSSGLQRSSPLVSMTEEDYEDHSLSLGDSELLANMLNTTTRPEVSYEQDDMLNPPDMNVPYLHYSQSTPTFRDNYLQQPTAPQMTPSMSNSTAQAATRSLWVGNMDATITVDVLIQVFSVFGPIESIRLLAEKECGFVNFYHVEDAIQAKEEVLTRLGGRIGNCIVRVGYGKADAAISDINTTHPTRALWLGNIPGNTTPTSLQALFSSFGQVESVRILSHKNCGFINFDLVESAVASRNALLNNEIGSPEFSGVRIGFAKVPPPKSSSELASNDDGTSSNEGSVLDTTEIWLNDLLGIMKQLGANHDMAHRYVKGLRASSYFDSIPPVPELRANRKFDTAHLREMRKRADNAVRGKKEAEAIAAECMDDIAEITSDYIGNTVVQRLFEKCSEATKTAMLERIAPHLAAISIHKNGTWATQKIIDVAKTPEQILLISQSLKPYIPPLLLDQFGNYAVQCCLNLGEPDRIQFIMDAMVEKLMTIAQGRFGARAMRGILENENVSIDQQKFVAAALCQNAVSLSTNANGALLLSWLTESTMIGNCLNILASRLAPHLTQLCTHKLGSQIVYKLINQTQDTEAQDIMLDKMQASLYDILSDQVRGVPLVQKVVDCQCLSLQQRQTISNLARSQLENLNGPGHRKLLEHLLEVNHDTL